MDTKFKEIASGIDISKSKLDVAIANFDGIVSYQEFSNDIEGAKLCLRFLLEHNCAEVVMESAGSHWYGTYDYLTANGIHVILVDHSRTKTHLTANKLDPNHLAIMHLLNQFRDSASCLPDNDIRRLQRRGFIRARDVPSPIRKALSNSLAFYPKLRQIKITSVNHGGGKGATKFSSVNIFGRRYFGEIYFVSDVDSFKRFISRRLETMFIGTNPNPDLGLRKAFTRYLHNHDLHWRGCYHLRLSDKRAGIRKWRRTAYRTSP
ncbi:MAG: IS110 family transposase [Nitrososphaerales archaeon]